MIRMDTFLDLHVHQLVYRLGFLSSFFFTQRRKFSACARHCVSSLSQCTISNGQQNLVIFLCDDAIRPVEKKKKKKTCWYGDVRKSRIQFSKQKGNSNCMRWDRTIREKGGSILCGFYWSIRSFSSVLYIQRERERRERHGEKGNGITGIFLLLNGDILRHRRIKLEER